MDAPIPATEDATQADVAACAAATADLLREFGRDELAEAVRGHAARPRRELPTVVVVGETKRGKSSLVNALLRRPGLSPVDIDVATCAHITFRHADDADAEVWVRGEPAPIRIDLGDLGRWAGEQGNPGNAAGVTAIDAYLPLELLRSVTVVDTPGVGGLELGHGELTLQALGDGDALLFVVDAAAPISRTELTFLARAAERIDTVALVLTKIDAYPHWRQIRDEDVELLRVHAPRFAVLPLPISSVNAERALRMGDGPDGLRERRRSGLDSIETLLSEWIANRAHLLAGANTMRSCLTAVAELQRLAAQQVAVANAAPNLDAELAAEQAQLAALTPEEAKWRAQLSTCIAKIRNNRAHEYAKRLDELKTRYEELATERQDAAALQRLAAQFTAAVDAMATDLARRTAAALVADVMGVIDVIADDTTLRENLSQIGAARIEAGPQYAPSDQPNAIGVELYTNVMPVLGIQRVLGLLIPGLGSIGALALGGAASMLLYRQRQTIARRNSFVSWMHRYAAAAREDDNHAFVDRMNDVQYELLCSLDAGIKRRITELAAARKEFETRKAETAAQRAPAAAAAQRQLAKVEALNHRIQRQLAALQHARATQPAPAHPQTDAVAQQ